MIATFLMSVCKRITTERLASRLSYLKEENLLSSGQCSEVRIRMRETRASTDSSASPLDQMELLRRWRCLILNRKISVTGTRVLLIKID